MHLTRIRIDLAAAVLGLLLLSSCPVRAQEPVADLGEIGAGTLLWKGPDGLVPLPARSTTVHIDVTGVLARGSVKQRFHNPTDRTIEVVYVFPLPDGAAVHRMEMVVGTRIIRAVVREREEARRTYVEARSEGRKAALVEQERPNLFTASAANINPGETVAVHLEYVEEVALEAGTFSLRFPLTFTPRYTASGAREPARLVSGFIAAERPEAARARLRMRIEPGVPLERAWSDSHEVRTFLDGDAWELEPVAGSVPTDRDFIVSWTPLAGEVPAAALFAETKDGVDYGLVMLLPGDAAGADPGLPTETLFVVDVSGSMDGPSIVQAREALLAALDRLRPGDRFNLLRFNNETAAFDPGFVDAVDDELERARAWVRDLRADGGTEILPALARGMAMVAASKPDERVQRVVFLTDGAVGNDDELFRVLSRGLGEARLHTIGIGHAPNVHLMRRMAALGRGSCTFVASTADAENRIDAFLRKIGRPLMTDVSLGWEGVEVAEPYPRRLPDLHSGEPLLVSFRLDEPQDGARVVLTGRLHDREVRQTLELTRRAEGGSGVALRWARARIRSLMGDLHAGADPAVVRKEVVDTALDFHVVTRFTSLVAVEEFASATGDAVPVRVANTQPGSARIGGPLLPMGGTSRPLLRLIAMILGGTGLVLLWVLRRGRLV